MAQRDLENWWNVDPEMRYAEVLCGQNLRVCVRLYQITMAEDADGFDMIGAAEAGTLEEAIKLAIEAAAK